MSREGTRSTSPWGIIKREWRVIPGHLWDELGKDNVSVAAASVGFYALFAMIPGIAALISIYGLISEPGDVESQLRQFRAILPPQATEIITDQLSRIAERPQRQLSLELVGAFLVSLWSANRGTKALLKAVHMAHDEEDRGFVRQNLVGLVFTLGAVLAVCTVLVLLVVLPSIIEFLGMERRFGWAMSLVRWPLLFVFLMGGLAALYYLGPRRRPPHIGWVVPGAVFATGLWLLGSWLLSLYVANFGDYSQVYGSLAAVVVLLLWFFVTAYVVLVGAEVNAMLDRQCRPARQDSS